MFTYKILTRDEYEDYQDFILFLERGPVRDLFSRDRALALGVTADTVKAGLGVLTFPPEKTGSAALIHTLHVLPAYRNKGIGAGIVAGLVQAARTEGWASVKILYVKEYDWAPALGHILARQGFEEVFRTNVFNIRVEKEDLAELLAHIKSLLRGKRSRLPPAYRLLPYGEMTPEMRGRMEEGRGKWFEQNVDPFFQPQRINREKSLLLLKQEEPVGWLIICDVGPRAVLYRNMILKPGHRGSGLFLIMLLKGLEWLCDSGKITRALFNTTGINKNMLSVMPKVLAPCVYTIKTSITLSKELR